jgi:CubicO group peptidase (beta-lactamase class C family)
MIRQRRRLLLILLITLGGSLLLPRRGRSQAALDTAEIDRFIASEMAAQRIPGLALAVIQGDQVTYVKGYGTTGGGQSVTPQTEFHIASLSKSFTATAVMQLVEEGKLDLDAPVRRYLPDFTLADPGAAEQITLRELLNHTSGLADGGVPDLRLERPATTADRIASLRNARPVAPPGSEFHYTDVNYQILASVAEAASGEPFSDYLQAHIFAPLQMTQTINVLSSFEVAQRAPALPKGHLLAYGVPVASGEEQGYLGGSAGVITTAADMAHYLIMHNSGGRFEGAQVLTPASVETMHTPPDYIDSDYAMGWLAHTGDGRRVLEHNGILSTFYAETVLLPDSGQGFVLLYNIHSLDQDLLGYPPIKQGLIDLVTGGQPPPIGFNVGLLSIAIAAITLVSVGFELRGLWRLPRWREQVAARPWWRHLWTLAWAFAPAVLVLAFPAIVLSTSDRAFGYFTLYRSMVGVMTWLGLCAVLGVINGVARAVWLLRRR